MNIYRPHQSADPAISVVIPTLPDRELQSLSALKEQSVAPEQYEIIVVEGADIDICQARNRGIKTARSDKIALTDDDTKPPSTWVEHALIALGAEFQLIHGPIRFISESGTTIEYRDCPRETIGCNLAFTKEAWEAVGGFNSDFAGWGDDVVFGWEIEDVYGLDRIQYSREFVMQHIGKDKSRWDWELAGLYRRRYPDRYFQFVWDTSQYRNRVQSIVVETAHRLHPVIGDYTDRILKKFN